MDIRLVSFNLIGVSFFALCFIVEFVRHRREGTHLVVMEFRIDRNPDAICPIRISGRPAGPIAWLSSFSGGEGSYVFRASRMDVTTEQVAASGIRTSFFPLSHVASTICEYRRSDSFFITALFLCILGIAEAVFVWFSTGADDYVQRLKYAHLAPSLGIFLGLALVSYLYFVITKRIVIDVESRGGDRLRFAFKRGFSKGISIDFDCALDLMEVLNNLVLSQASPIDKEPTVETT